MTTALTLLFVLFLCGPTGAQDLSPDALADQYLLEATKALENGNTQRALSAFGKIETLDTEPPPEFTYFYGKLLVENSTTLDDLLKGQALLQQFVISIEKDSEYYTPTLELLSVTGTESEKAADSPAGEVFKDCPACPQMVVVSAGAFLMGSPASEVGRAENEGPRYWVRVPTPLAVGVYEVTVAEYSRFVGATGHEGGSGCFVWTGKSYKLERGRTWRDPGFRQTERDPVVCVSWEDVQAYTAWLSRETGKGYRLLSEAEWEYVARAGNTTARYWGEPAAGQCQYANGADSSTELSWRIACNDGYARTAPVGSYQANRFGLYDVLGNVGEWVQDCWNNSYQGAPSDGRAWESGRCSSRRVQRGGSWINPPRNLRSASRAMGFTDDNRSGYYRSNGFRIARSLP